MSGLFPDVSLFSVSEYVTDMTAATAEARDGEDGAVVVDVGAGAAMQVPPTTTRDTARDPQGTPPDGVWIDLPTPPTPLDEGDAWVELPDVPPTEDPRDTPPVTSPSAALTGTPRPAAAVAAPAPVTMPPVATADEPTIGGVPIPTIGGVPIPTIGGMPLIPCTSPTASLSTERHTLPSVPLLENPAGADLHVDVGRARPRTVRRVRPQQDVAYVPMSTSPEAGASAAISSPATVPPYMSRSQIQNAVDPASHSGTLAVCEGVCSRSIPISLPMRICMSHTLSLSFLCISYADERAFAVR